MMLRCCRLELLVRRRLLPVVQGHRPRPPTAAAPTTLRPGPHRRARPTASAPVATTVAETIATLALVARVVAGTAVVPVVAEAAVVAAANVATQDLATAIVAVAVATRRQLLNANVAARELARAAAAVATLTLTPRLPHAPPVAAHVAVNRAAGVALPAAVVAAAVAAAAVAAAAAAVATLTLTPRLPHAPPAAAPVVTAAAPVPSLRKDRTPALPGRPGVLTTGTTARVRGTNRSSTYAARTVRGSGVRPSSLRGAQEARAGIREGLQASTCTPRACRVPGNRPSPTGHHGVRMAPKGTPWEDRASGAGTLQSGALSLIHISEPTRPY